jgi:hypothetical protein
LTGKAPYRFESGFLQRRVRNEPAAGAEAGNFPDLARFYLEEVVERGKGLFRRVLERGVAHGEFRPLDTESVVLCVIAPLLLASLWRHSFEPHSDHPLDIGALCRAHLDPLRRGLAAELGGEPSSEGAIQ